MKSIRISLAAFAPAVSGGVGAMEPLAAEAPKKHLAVPDEVGWSTILRLYGPLPPSHDTTWRSNDIELVS